MSIPFFIADTGAGGLQDLGSCPHIDSCRPSSSSPSSLRFSSSLLLLCLLVMGIMGMFVGAGDCCASVLWGFLRGNAGEYRMWKKGRK